MKAIIQSIFWFILPQRVYRWLLKDDCEICGGTMGGVWGNENWVVSCGESVLMCDYCHANEIRQPGFWKLEP